MANTLTLFHISTLLLVEEEKEAHTAVYAETAIAAYKVEAEDITTMAQAAHLRKDYAILSASA